MNKEKCQQKYINENLFDDFDDILNDTDNNSEILGNQLLPVEKYLLNFFITHDNEDYQYEIYQTYLIIMFGGYLLKFINLEKILMLYYI